MLQGEQEDLDTRPRQTYARGMGKVIERIKVENWEDLAFIAAGKRRKAPRSVEVEALVDTGAVLLYLQSSVVKKLGLRPIDTVRSRTMSDLLEERRVCSPVELVLAGRKGLFRVIEVPNSLPNLIGQLPLEELDLVVDPRRRRVVPNPEHPDGPLFDEFWSAWAADHFTSALPSGSFTSHAMKMPYSTGTALRLQKIG